MKKIFYIVLVVISIGSLTSCSNKLCPAYGNYHGK
jgi:hypothetical protein